MADADLTRVVAWAHEMRSVHNRLRDALDLARAAAELGESPTPPTQDQLLYCWGFCLALTGHHRGEDDVLFPAVVREHPDLAGTVASLERDHSMIDHLLGAYRLSLDAGHDPETLLRHLEGIGALMESHFRFEERRLLPVLERLALAAAPAEVYGPLAE
jgi:hemerythrin-like domain-containing protein